jgi:hypothetical protein
MRHSSNSVRRRRPTGPAPKPDPRPFPRIALADRAIDALALIRAAARSAVHAPTPQEAADIAFGALVQLDGVLRGDASAAAQQLAACAGQFHIGARYPDGWLVGINDRNQAVILLPGDAWQVDWHEAKEWAASVGGELPTLAELTTPTILHTFRASVGIGRVLASG